MPYMGIPCSRERSNIKEMVYLGNRSCRARLRKEFVRKTVGPDFPIIVTTYNMVLVEQKWLAKYDWKYVVVDEVKEEHISESLHFYHFSLLYL